MAEARDIRRRVVWPLLVLLFAGVMIMTNRSPTGSVAASDQEIERWVADWARAHIDGSSQALPTANPVLDRSLSRRLRALGGTESAPLMITISPGPDDDSRRVRIERGTNAFVVIIVHELRGGTLVVSGVVAEDAPDNRESPKASGGLDVPAASDTLNAA